MLGVTRLPNKPLQKGIRITVVDPRPNLPDFIRRVEKGKPFI